MEDESEVIRQQMTDSRTALTEKLEALEQKVTGTVEATTSAINDTMAAVTGTVESVKDNVAGTVEAVKDSVGNAVESVRHSLDVSRHTENYPWLMFGGAVAVGFAVGALLPSPRRTGSSRGLVHSAWDAVAGGGVPHGHTTSDRQLSEGMAAAARPLPQAPPAPTSASNGASQGWLGGLGAAFGPEFDKLKGLALGLVMGAARDLITASVPPAVRGQVGEVVNNVTRKLGGEPTRG